MNEDENGHPIDADGRLIYDPRCWFCRYAEIDAEGGS